MGTHNFRKQKKNLENEGVVLAGDGQLSLNQFQWKKRAPVSKSKKAPQIFSKRKSK
jgi:hypothetical protein